MAARDVGRALQAGGLRRSLPLKNLYVDAAGVIWALWVLGSVATRRRGSTSPGLRCARWMLGVALYAADCLDGRFRYPILGGWS